MKRNLFKILVLGGVSMIAVSCGGGGGGGQSDTSKPAGGDSTSAPSTGSSSQANTSTSGGGSATSKVEISFWHTFGQTIQDNLNPQIEAFEKLIKDNEGVDVEVKLTPYSDYATINSDINTKLKTNDIPTIAVAYPDHIADYLLFEGDTPGKYIVDFNDYINDSKVGLGKEAFLGDAKNDSIDDFIPAYLEGGRSFSRQGQLCLPYMKSTEAMLYNYDAVVKVLAHYKPEFQGAENKIKNYMENLDWAEFMNLCKETAKYKNEINPALEQVAYYDSDANLFISQLYQSNIPYASIVENQGKKGGHVDFESGAARTNAENMVKSLKNYYDDRSEGVRLFSTKGTQGGYGSNSFKNIESVFVIGSTGGSGYSLTSTFKIGVCKVPPVVANNPLYVTQGPELCIFNNPSLSQTANSKRTLYAWKLIKYLTNSENNCKICLQGSEGYLPVRQSSYEEDLYLDFLDSGIQQADIANVVTDTIDGHFLNTPCFAGSTDLRTACGSLLTDCLLTDSVDKISGIFQTAIDNAIRMFK